MSERWVCTCVGRDKSIFHADATCPVHGEPVASPQATEMQTRILDAAYAQQKRMESTAQQPARAVAPVETPKEKTDARNRGDEATTRY
jgi:hypothetical protein